MAWDINAVKTKLEKSHVQTLLLDYDISLSETKTQLNVNLPGFVTFRRVNSVSSHGLKREDIPRLRHFWETVTSGPQLVRTGSHNILACASNGIC